MAELSKSQIDKLGDRLRVAPATESDLRMLDEFRYSYIPTSDAVLTILRRRHVLEPPVARNIKSTLSIVAKLRREPIRLSRIQDIAGCRIVEPNIFRQNQEVYNLSFDFPSAKQIDRRSKPSHGYRAVHVIVQVHGKPFEIQVRSYLQHQWAELSEKASDVVDPEIKYGGAGKGFQVPLKMISNQIAEYEAGILALTDSRPTGLITKALSEEREDKLAQLHGMIGLQVRELMSILEGLRRHS